MFSTPSKTLFLLAFALEAATAAPVSPAPITVAPSPAPTNKVTQAQDPCSCPPGQVVTLPDAIIPFITNANISCADLEAQAQNGNLSETDCALLQAFGVGEECGCSEETAPTIIPSPAETPAPVVPETPAPVIPETPAPVMELPTSSEPTAEDPTPVPTPVPSPPGTVTGPPTSSPTSTPTTAPAQPSLFDTVLGIVLWPLFAIWNVLIFIINSIAGLFV